MKHKCKKCHTRKRIVYQKLFLSVKPVWKCKCGHTMMEATDETLHWDTRV